MIPFDKSASESVLQLSDVFWRRAAAGADDTCGPALSVLEIAFGIGGVRIDPALFIVHATDVAVGHEWEVFTTEGLQLVERMENGVGRHAVHSQGFYAKRQKLFNGMGEGLAG